jgi:hypothetical protein
VRSGSNGAPARAADGASGARTLPLARSDRRDLSDMIDQRDREERTQNNERSEPIEKADRNEPTEPIEKAEPTEPIDKNEPLEPMDNTESSDHRDQRDGGAGELSGRRVVTSASSRRRGRERPCLPSP